MAQGCCFKEVNITFTTEKRLGLVGINGTGKSTFLKILAGQMEADKGTIERNGKASIHYLAQTPDFDAESTFARGRSRWRPSSIANGKSL